MFQTSELNKMQARKISEISREELIADFVQEIENGHLPLDKYSIMEAIKRRCGGEEVLEMMGWNAENLASIVRLQALVNLKKAGKNAN